MTVMRIAAAQTPNVVGDFDGNAERTLEAMRWAEGEGADVLVLPELSLTGYPLSDLALQTEFVDDARAALERLAGEAGDVVTVVGTCERVPEQHTWDSRPRDVAISSALLCCGEIRGVYHKVLLPTHGAYDEGRTFAAGRRPDALWLIGDVVAGVVICEDLWSGDGPPEAQAAAGARIILAPNASPYWHGKAAGRRRLVERVARRNGVPVVYVNLVGGQDELVFDGGSLVADRRGQIVYRAPEFAESRAVVDLELPEPRAVTRPVTTVHTRPLPAREHASTPGLAPLHDTVPGIWQALVTGTRDFARRNGYDRAVLGLSGGIDSAVTAAVAADALGGEQVLALAMPAPGSPEDEQRDAAKLAANLGIAFETIAVDGAAGAMAALGRYGVDEPDPATREQTLARARAAMLWALADEDHRIVLATANKSELSVGAAVLHGDVAGHFAPLRDCPKTLLYELARHRNARAPVIPQEVLRRPTTAQRRGDGWPPPYEVLDGIVEGYIEDGRDIEDLVASGYSAEITVEVVRRIEDAEFLRRYAPPGVKVSPRAFSLDRRVPISNAWRPHRGERQHPRGPERPWTGSEEQG